MYDWRLLENGLEIPAVTYADQPYIIRCNDGAWLCCVTTGSGEEGAPGQHVSTCRSTDGGKSWEKPVPVETPGDVENSYAVLLKAPSGRVFVFYNRNSDNVREILSHDRQEVITRVDSLGHFVFKYSDDNGRSWSRERYDIPFRLFECDRTNVYGGKLCFFWNVGRPFIHNGTAYVTLNKVGEMGRGFFQRSEGCLLASPNLLTADNPADAAWETLPEGETGIRPPEGAGPVGEEHCVVPLSDGSFYDTFRTIAGHPAEAYSRDGGKSWQPPQFMRYADGRPVKHPRAANFVWKCENGNYLYWFHNHGGRFIALDPYVTYEDRNPVWLLAGIEADSPEGKVIRWGEPELLLYSDDPMIRISYPDLVEENGRYFVTETEKNKARLHEIPAEFLAKMWRRAAGETVEPEAEELDWRAEKFRFPPFLDRNCEAVNRPSVRTRNGYALRFELEAFAAGTLFDHTGPDGRGERVELLPDGRIAFYLSDGCGGSTAVSEPLPDRNAGRLTVNVDGGAGIVSFVWNGRFLDGGDFQQFGWRRFDPQQVPRPNPARAATGAGVASLRIYARPLMTCES